MGRSLLASAAGRPDDRTPVATLGHPGGRDVGRHGAVRALMLVVLVDEGRLRLDDRAFPLLDTLPPPPEATVDPRLDQITVQNLLQHSGGWNSAKSFDPQYLPWTLLASHRRRANDPPSAQAIVRFM